MLKLLTPDTTGIWLLAPLITHPPPCTLEVWLLFEGPQVHLLFTYLPWKYVEIRAFLLPYFVSSLLFFPTLRFLFPPSDSCPTDCQQVLLFPTCIPSVSSENHPRHTDVWLLQFSGQRFLLHIPTMRTPLLDLTESCLDEFWTLEKFPLSQWNQQTAANILHIEKNSTVETFITLAPHTRLIFSHFTAEIVRIISSSFSSQNWKTLTTYLPFSFSLSCSCSRSHSLSSFHCPDLL